MSVRHCPIKPSVPPGKVNFGSVTVGWAFVAKKSPNLPGISVRRRVDLIHLIHAEYHHVSFFYLAFVGRRFAFVWTVGWSEFVTEVFVPAEAVNAKLILDKLHILSNKSSYYLSSRYKVVQSKIILYYFYILSRSGESWLHIMGNISRTLSKEFMNIWRGFIKMLSLSADRGYIDFYN